MNKLAIPAILATTIFIAGILAFITVDKATTIDTAIISGVWGVTTTVTESVTTEDVDDEIIAHHFILTTDKPFTIHDVTVKGEITGSDSDADAIFLTVRGYPDEYGFDVSSAEDDAKNVSVFDDMVNGAEVVDGDDVVNPKTWSMIVADSNSATAALTFGPNHNFVVELCFVEVSDGSADYTAMVTFHLRGVTQADVLAGDVAVEVIEDVDFLACDSFV